MLRDRGCWWAKWPKPSPTSSNCHQHISSPTSVTNIDVAVTISLHSVIFYTFVVVICLIRNFHWSSWAFKVTFLHDDSWPKIVNFCQIRKKMSFLGCGDIVQIKWQNLRCCTFQTKWKYHYDTTWWTRNLQPKRSCQKSWFKIKKIQHQTILAAINWINFLFKRLKLIKIVDFHQKCNFLGKNNKNKRYFHMYYSNEERKIELYRMW